MTATDDHPVTIRTWSDGGGCDRTFPAHEVPAEVTFLAGTGKFRRIELRAEGADNWHTVHATA